MSQAPVENEDERGISEGERGRGVEAREGGLRCGGQEERRGIDGFLLGSKLVGKVGCRERVVERREGREKDLPLASTHCQFSVPELPKSAMSISPSPPPTSLTVTRLALLALPFFFFTPSPPSSTGGEELELEEAEDWLLGWSRRWD